MFIGSSVSLIITAIMFIAIVRLLGPQTYGIYVIAIAVTGIFGAVGNFGIGQSLTKFASQYLAKKERQKLNTLFSSSYLAAFLISGVFTLVVFITAAPLSELTIHSIAYKGVIQVASIIIVLNIMYGMGINALIGIGNGRDAAIVITLMTIIQATVSIMLALLGFGAYAPLIGLICAYGAGFLYSSFSVFVKARIKLIVPSKDDISKLMGFTYKLMIADFVGGEFNNLVIVALGIVATSAIVGNVGVASKTGNLIGVATGAIGFPLLSAFSATYSRKRLRHKMKDFYSMSIYISFVFVAPLLMTLIVLAKPFSYVAFSGLYNIAPTYIRIASIGFLFGIFGFYANAFLLAAGKVRELLKYTIITVLIGLLAMPFLLVWFQGIGAAILIFVIMPVLTDIFFTYYIKRDFGLDLHSRKLLRVLLANIAASLFLLPLIFIFGGNYIWIVISSVIVMCIVYPPLLALMRGASKNDILRIKTITEKMPLIGPIVGELGSYSIRFAVD